MSLPDSSVPRRSPFVWYVAYGSNLSLNRFKCYVQGGRPEGATQTYPGCSDRTMPRQDRPFIIPYALYFGGKSLVWEGAVAYLDHWRRPGRVTLGRAFLLSMRQFEQLFLQESRRRHLSANLMASRARGFLTVARARYGRILYLGTMSGYPVLTFTSPRPAPSGQAPGSGYLSTMYTGLFEAYGMSDGDTADYLLSKPGVREHWDRDALLLVLRKNSTH